MKSELDLYPLWQSFCKSGRKSFCGRLQGLEAGQLNTSEGPDFKNALFILDNTRYCGDVEIHLRAADWYSHGHQHDSRYDHVMLHLVWAPQVSDRRYTKTSTGREVPTLSMRNFPPSLVPEDRVARCRSTETDPHRFKTKIKKILQQRLLGQGRIMHTLTCRDSADQVFYEGFLRILGSPQNVQNFQWIAQKLNWKMIGAVKLKFHLSVLEWYAVFLHLAGLMYTHKEFVPLRGLSHRLAHIVPAVQLTRPMWKLAGQRPSHNPIRRLAGLALFIKNFPAPSICAVFQHLCTDRVPYNILKKRMRALFQPEIPPEMRKVFPARHAQNMWGEDLISEMIGNVVIPYFYYRAYKNGRSGFKEYLESVYYGLPLTSTYACIRNFLNWPEVHSHPHNKFFLNQALLHVRQNYCLNDLCRACPLGRIAESR